MSLGDSELALELVLFRDSFLQLNYRKFYDNFLAKNIFSIEFYQLFDVARGFLFLLNGTVHDVKTKFRQLELVEDLLFVDVDVASCRLNLEQSII